MVQGLMRVLWKEKEEKVFDQRYGQAQCFIINNNNGPYVPDAWGANHSPLGLH